MRDSRFKLLFIAVASLVFLTGAMIAQPVTDNQSGDDRAVNDKALVILQDLLALLDEPECPDLTPTTPNGPNQLLCYLNWRAMYLFGEITCAEYTAGVEECESIPD